MPDPNPPSARTRAMRRPRQVARGCPPPWRWVVASLAVALGGHGLASAAAAKKPGGTGDDSEKTATMGLSVRRAQLDNGLRVVMNRDTSSPTVAVTLTYGVGSRHERRGQRGMSHLLELIHFNGGSKNAKKGEQFVWVSQQGGHLDSHSSRDQTTFSQVLPSHALALGLWLQADRMKALTIDQEILDAQRSAFRDEYRVQVAGRAYARGYRRLLRLVFAGYEPYENLPLGEPTDLETTELDDVRAFWRDHYGPNNAVLSLSGNFQAVEAMRLVHRHFGNARRRKVAREPNVEANATARNRRASVQDAQATTVGQFYGWTIPPARHRDHRALQLTAQLLAGTESARLERTLVDREAVAREVRAWTDDNSGPGLFGIRVLLNEDADPDLVRQLVESELGSLARRGPSQSELDRCKSLFRNDFLLSLEGNRERALELALFEYAFGDARLLAGEIDEYLDVRPRDVQTAVSQYLTRDRRSDVTVLPVGPGATEGPGSSRSARVSEVRR